MHAVACCRIHRGPLLTGEPSSISLECGTLCGFFATPLSTLGLARVPISFVTGFRRSATCCGCVTAFPGWHIFIGGSAFESRASSLCVGLGERLPVLRSEDGGVGTSIGLFLKERKKRLVLLALPSSDMLGCKLRILLFAHSTWSKSAAINLRFRFAAALISACSFWSIVFA